MGAPCTHPVATEVLGRIGPGQQQISVHHFDQNIVAMTGDVELRCGGSRDSKILGSRIHSGMARCSSQSHRSP